MLNSLISRANCRANCCWKSKWLCLLKKTLNNAGHIDTKLIDFSKICQKNPAKSAAFYWLFLGKVSPRKFAPENPSKFDFFPAKIPRNWTIFPQICPCKSREILLFFSAKYQKPCFYYSHNVTVTTAKHIPIGYIVMKAYLDDMLGTCPEKWTGYISGEVPAAHLLWLQTFWVSGVSPP